MSKDFQNCFSKCYMISHYLLLDIPGHVVSVLSHMTVFSVWGCVNRCVCLLCASA